MKVTEIDYQTERVLKLVANGAPLTLMERMEISLLVEVLRNTPEDVILHRTSVTNNELSNLEWVPTTLQEPTSNNKSSGDTKVASSASLPVNEVQDVTEEVLEFLAELNDHIEPPHSLKDSRMWFDYEDLLDKLKSGEYSVIHNTNIN